MIYEIGALIYECKEKDQLIVLSAELLNGELRLDPKEACVSSRAPVDGSEFSSRLDFIVASAVQNARLLNRLEEVLRQSFVIPRRRLERA